MNHIRKRIGLAVNGPFSRANVQRNRTEHTKEAANINFGQSSDEIVQQQQQRMWTSNFTAKKSQCQWRIRRRKAL